jgi:DNA processing protein
MEEGTDVRIPGREFGLVVGQPAEFRFFTSSSRKNDQPGDLIEDYADALEELAPMEVAFEAGETSGALITAEFAAEQGREVFAVPGSILAPQSKGTNKLIQQGALPLLSINDLMQALDLTRMGEHKAARKVIPADETEARVMNVLGPQPLHVDEIRSQTELPIEKVSATLALMELKGMVRQVGGMNYVAVREEQSDYST